MNKIKKLDFYANEHMRRANLTFEQETRRRTMQAIRKLNLVVGVLNHFIQCHEDRIKARKRRPR